MSEEHFEKKKELKEIEKKLEKKKREIDKLEIKKADLENRSRKGRKIEKEISFLKNELPKNLEKISPEETLLIEKGGNQDFFFLDLLLLEDDDPVYLGRWPSDADYHARNSSRIMTNRQDDQDLGPYKYIEEEIETIDGHDHGYDLNHCTWKISGEELQAFKGLVCDSEFRDIYRKEGWSGLKELANFLRDKLDEVYPDVRDVFEGDDFNNPMVPYKIYREVERRIINHGLENEDLTVKEAITALKLKDKEFSERFEKRKKIIRDRLDELEEAFGNYFDSNGKENGGG